MLSAGDCDHDVNIAQHVLIFMAATQREVHALDRSDCLIPGHATTDHRSRARHFLIAEETVIQLRRVIRI